MALIHADFVEETTTTTGTGTLSLDGATVGCRTFTSTIGNGNTCVYGITSFDNLFESGIGTVVAGTPNTLARTTLLSSSTGSKLNLPVGTHRVYCTFVAEGGTKAYTALQQTDVNTFKTVAITGQTDVVADTISDTLTLVQGSNIGLTSNAGTDSITITSYPPTMDCRLSLQSNHPAPFGDVSGSTLYYLGYKGTQAELWNGTDWRSYYAHGISLAIGTRTAGLPYDVFLYLNAGVPALELTAWTNGTTRATGLAYTDGRYVKASDPTRRIIGTVMPNTTTTIADTSLWRGVSNIFNHVSCSIDPILPGGAHSYTTYAWREYNAGVGVTRGNFVLSANQAIVQTLGGTVSVAFSSIGIATDTTTSYNLAVAGYTNDSIFCKIGGSIILALGAHYMTATELGNTGSSQGYAVIQGILDK